MSVWARLARAFGLVRPVDPSRTMGYVPVGWMPPGLRITTEEATSISVVWACIQCISTAIASSPWNVFEVRGRKRAYLAEDQLAFILNQRANPEITAVAFREAMMFGALAYGNAYAEIQKDMAGRVVGLVPLFPDRMSVERSEAGALEYVYKNWDGGEVVLRPDQVFHLRGPVSVSGLMGDSVVGRAAKAAALSAAAERFSLGYLANGTITSMVLTTPNRVSEDSMKKMRDQWTEKMTGPRNAGKPLILESGMKAEQVGADPDRAQLLQTRAYSTQDIARYFSVPLVKIGVPEAAQWGANIEALNQEFYRTGLRPWALRLEQEANAKLLSPRPYRETEIDMEWMYRGSALDQANADAARIKSGVWSVNEVRERIGDNSIGPEGDLRFIEGTMTPLTTTLLEIQELAAKEPEPDPAPSAESADSTDTGADSEEEDDAEDTPVVRQALRMTFAQNFARMEKRLASKASELARQKVPNRKRDELLAAYEKRIREELLEECLPHLNLIRKFAASQGRHLNGEADTALLDAVEQLGKGKVADRAADGLIRALLPEANG